MTLGLMPEELILHLKRTRLIKGLTRPELAGIFGIRNTTLGRWETRKRVPSPKNQRMIFEWLQEVKGTPPDAVVIAYWAGLFDGEGMITIGRGAGTRPAPFFVLVSLTNTDADIIKDFHHRFGGRLHQIPSNDFNKRPVSVVTLASKQACKFIALVHPYLRLKRRHADLALTLEEFIRSYGTGRKLSPEELTKRKQLYEAMRQLNQRGISGAAI